MTGIVRLNHVSLLVENTQRALAFYHGVLGLPVSQDRPDLEFPGAWLDLGMHQQIHLLELSSPDKGRRHPAHGGRDHHVALDVHDLDALISALENAGIAYTLSRSGRRALFCRDPDGNAIELVEQPDGAATSGS